MTDELASRIAELDRRMTAPPNNGVQFGSQGNIGLAALPRSKHGLWFILALPRPERLADLHKRLFTDPDVLKYTTVKPSRDILETEQIMANWPALHAISRPVYVVEQLPEKQACGTVEVQLSGHRVGLSYMFARNVWGRGIASGVVRLALDAAFADPAVHRVWANVDCENLRSITLLEAVGMEREGRMRKYIIHPNVSAEPRDVYAYAKVRE